MSRKEPPTLPYPQYLFIPSPRLGELTEDFWYKTSIDGYTAKTLSIDLHDDGWLCIRSGYKWDFGSGPAIDTPDMVVASLVHDAGCDLTASGALPWECRRKFDREFRRVLKRYGTPFYRRWYCWLAVRFDALILDVPPSAASSQLSPRRRRRR